MDNATKRKLDAQFAAARSLNPESVIPEKERYKATIEDVFLGGVIRYRSKTYVVQEIGTYYESNEAFSKKTGDMWAELKLFCIENGETVNMEWEKDDEIEAHITEQELNFSHIKDDRGDALDEDDLDDLAEEEDTIFLDKVAFSYDDDYPALYEREGKPGEKVYFYDFVSSDKKTITIEEWNSGSGREKYQIFLSREINPDSIEVIAKGA